MNKAYAWLKKYSVIISLVQALVWPGAVAMTWYTGAVNLHSAETRLREKQARNNLYLFAGELIRADIIKEIHLHCGAEEHEWSPGRLSNFGDDDND